MGLLQDHLLPTQSCWMRKLGHPCFFNHIDIAHNYNNQRGVGKALAQFDRSSYFLTTKVMAVDSDTYKGTTSGVQWKTSTQQARQRPLACPISANRPLIASPRLGR